MKTWSYHEVFSFFDHHQYSLLLSDFKADSAPQLTTNFCGSTIPFELSQHTACWFHADIEETPCIHAEQAVEGH